MKRLSRVFIARQGFVHRNSLIGFIDGGDRTAQVLVEPTMRVAAELWNGSLH